MKKGLVDTFEDMLKPVVKAHRMLRYGRDLVENEIRLEVRRFCISSLVGLSFANAPTEAGFRLWGHHRDGVLALPSCAHEVPAAKRG